jgi:hypothetical protein
MDGSAATGRTVSTVTAPGNDVIQVEGDMIRLVDQTERSGLACVFKREDHRLVFVAGCPSSFKCLADQHSIAI